MSSYFVISSLSFWAEITRRQIYVASSLSCASWTYKRHWSRCTRKSHFSVSFRYRFGCICGTLRRVFNTPSDILSTAQHRSTRIRFTDNAVGNKSNFHLPSASDALFHFSFLYFLGLAFRTMGEICVECISPSYQWWMECLTVYGAAACSNLWAHEPWAINSPNIPLAMLTWWIMDSNMHEQASCA